MVMPQVQMPEDPDAVRQDRFIIHELNLSSNEAGKATLVTPEMPYDALFVDAIPGERNNTMRIIYLVKGNTMFEERRADAWRRAFKERSDYIDGWIANNVVEDEGEDPPTGLNVSSEILDEAEASFANSKRAEAIAMQVIQDDPEQADIFNAALIAAQEAANGEAVLGDDERGSAPGDTGDDEGEEEAGEGSLRAGSPPSISDGEEDIRKALGEEGEEEDNDG